jgi:hypothetical protein
MEVFSKQRLCQIVKIKCRSASWGRRNLRYGVRFGDITPIADPEVSREYCRRAILGPAISNRMFMVHAWGVPVGFWQFAIAVDIKIRWKDEKTNKA